MTTLFSNFLSSLHNVLNKKGLYFSADVKPVPL